MRVVFAPSGVRVLGMEKMSRAVLSKIEAGLRCVTDKELLLITKALEVELPLFPPLKAAREKRSKRR